MDRQNRVGSKIGAGGIASTAQQNADRRNRLRKLAFETVDLAKDPYLMRNHLGSYECRLCLTLHSTEGSYLAHIQGRKHQEALSRRAAHEVTQVKTAAARIRQTIRINTLKIGKPGFKITRLLDPTSKRQGFLFQLVYPMEAFKELQNIEPVGQVEPLPIEGEVNDYVQINDKICHEPLFRFMSAFEQKVEEPNKDYQYLVFSLYPFENIAFKIPSKPIDRSGDLYWTHWDEENGIYYLQVMYK